MSKEICISSTPHETRLAILEDDQLTEVYYERENEYTLAGSIYKGRVTRVLPGMQSAFVDLGLERDAFLYVTDFMEEQEDSSDFERIPANGRPRRTGPGTAGQGEPRTAPPRAGIRRRRRSSTAQRRPGRFGRGSIRRQAPAGEFEDGTRRWRAAVAAARAFAHRTGRAAGSPGTDGPSAAPEVIPRRRPSSQPRPVEAGPASARLRSLFPASRFRSMAVRALPTPALPVDGRAPQPRANVILAKPSTLIETPLAVERRLVCSRRIHLPLSRCPLARPRLRFTTSQLFLPTWRKRRPMTRKLPSRPRIWSRMPLWPGQRKLPRSMKQKRRKRYGRQK